MMLFGTRKNPKGPSTKKLVVHELDLSGTRIHFQTPEHSEHMVSFQQKACKYNIYDENLYGSRKEIIGEIPGIVCYREGWSFTGFPIISGRIGDLTQSIVVYHNPRHGSLFRPQNLVKAIEDQINVSKGPRANIMWRYHSRLNWGVTSLHTTEWVHYDTKCIQDLNGSTSWVIPVTDEHYLFFFFTRYIFKPDTNLDAAYDKLIDTIMSTVKIDWSADALRMQEQARQQWPDEKLPAELPELRWDESEYKKYKELYRTQSDMDNEEFDKVITEYDLKKGRMQA